MVKPKEDLNIRADWSGAEDEPVQVVNMFAAQANPNHHVVNFGFVAPPVVVDSIDLERARELKSLPVRVVARLFLTPTDMQQLVKILSDNIQAREKILKSEREQ